ncbi:MAG: hypothetical protein Q8O98_01775, partial [bacterium]|nr:hypothetical protein [bacterium]
NHKILKKMERRFRWAFAWGVIKIFIIAIPLIIGYIYLQPHFEAAASNWNEVKEFVNVSRQFLR